VFPPTQSAVLAEFLCILADKFPSPRAVLRGTLLAMDSVYQVCGATNPTQSIEIRNLCTALIKSKYCTTYGIRSVTMPIQPFVKMF